MRINKVPKFRMKEDGSSVDYVVVKHRIDREALVVTACYILDTGKAVNAKSINNALEEILLYYANKLYYGDLANELEEYRDEAEAAIKKLFPNWK